MGAILFAILTIVLATLAYWFVDQQNISDSYLGSALPFTQESDQLSGPDELALFSIYTFFHASFATYAPHGLDKIVVALEMGLSWLGQIMLIVWPVARLLGPRGDQSSA